MMSMISALHGLFVVGLWKGKTKLSSAQLESYAGSGFEAEGFERFVM